MEGIRECTRRLLPADHESQLTGVESELSARHLVCTKMSIALPDTLARDYLLSSRTSIMQSQISLR